MLYEVTHSPNFDFPVGHQFESDNLHPSMHQHVRPVGVVKTRKEESVVDEVDTREQDQDAAFVAASKENKAFDLRNKPKTGDSENT